RGSASTATSVLIPGPQAESEFHAPLESLGSAGGPASRELSAVGSRGGSELGSLLPRAGGASCNMHSAALALRGREQLGPRQLVRGRRQLVSPRHRGPGGAREGVQLVLDHFLAVPPAEAGH